MSAYGTISTTPTAATPTFSPAPGSYTNPISVTLSDSTSGATIHCTTDGTTPTVNSPACGNVAINSTTILKAMATASGFNPSAVASGTFIIDSGATGTNYGSGFTSTGLTFNGAAKLNGTRLRLTDTGKNEAGSAFISTPIGVQTFTTDFSFQLSSASADGFTFTIQGVGPTALGPLAGGLGYGADKPGGTPGIANSVAVKFDFYNDAGEGTDSTGLYTDGDLSHNSRSEHDQFRSSSAQCRCVQRSYDVRRYNVDDDDHRRYQLLSNFTAHWTINIPGTVGSNTAYVGFTGSTGGLTAIQEILDWTYVTKSINSGDADVQPRAGHSTLGSICDAVGHDGVAL